MSPLTLLCTADGSGVAVKTRIGTRKDGAGGKGDQGEDGARREVTLSPNLQCTPCQPTNSSLLRVVHAVSREGTDIQEGKKGGEVRQLRPPRAGRGRQWRPMSEHKTDEGVHVNDRVMRGA